MDDSACVLAIDLGTSGPKVGVVDAEGVVLARAFEPLPTQMLPDGGAEQDPNAWWSAIESAVADVLGRVRRERVDSIAVTAQWSGTVAIDERGEALGNAIIWMDSRGRAAVRDIVGGPAAGYAPLKALRWIRLTGGAPALSGKDSLAHILFIQREDRERFEKASCFLEPKDYLNFKLTGKQRAGFDSIAMHWLTDNRTPGRVEYSAELLAACGLSKDKLPSLASPSSVLGPLRRELAERWGLTENVQVVMGAPDVHSSALGSGAVDHYVPHLYIGTSSWCSCHLPRKRTDVLHNMAALPSALPDRYLLLNEQETAGACVEHILTKWLFADSNESAKNSLYGRFDDLAKASPPGSNGLLFLPWLYGERTPVEDSLLRGGFFNYSLNTERSDIARAVLEGVALNTRWLFDHVESFTRRRLDELRIVGGGAQSKLWCQIFADILNRRILQVRSPIDAGLRGVALLARLSTGQLTIADIPNRVPIEQGFIPRQQHRRLYDERFEVLLQFHRQNKSLFHRLNARGQETPT